MVQLTPEEQEVVARHKRKLADQDMENLIWFLSELRTTSEIRTILDVGAHCGETALLFELACPDAQIHTFEPDPDVYQRLCLNTATKPRIQAHNVAFGETAGMVLFRRNHDPMTSSMLASLPKDENYLGRSKLMDTREEIRVCQAMLEQWAPWWGLGVIDILKTDTQGYEMQVLRGCGAMLTPARIRSVIVELNWVPMYEGQSRPGEILDYLVDRGYGVHSWINVAYRHDNRCWAWSDALCVGTVPASVTGADPATLGA